MTVVQALLCGLVANAYLLFMAVLFSPSRQFERLESETRKLAAAFGTDVRELKAEIAELKRDLSYKEQRLGYAERKLCGLEPLQPGYFKIDLADFISRHTPNG